MKAASLRARVRAEMTDEIKAVARRHLSTDGANLSLRAVARDLGMASSAVYRYFASRDELLTALIIDAYGSLGDAAEAAPREWLAVCHAIREWALAHPHEWALIYGSPVPGYRAPRDTVPAAARVILALARIVAAAEVAEGEPVTGPLADELQAVADGFAPGTAPQVVGRAMGAWLHCCGAISAELFGQLQDTVEARRDFFEFQMRGAARWVGLT
ncbi:TetR/AcrR family transcriptional regulator [Symbioplanes lichenis]|uniref:TetR/AcrR family transcriptional regulator n=1 Tax=Symbioplanes lichenis TaxID=1629072 RepID=UPI002738EB3F|nr:TetR/AcrR family transcriptional regulator [Actinoplanes lichenis]